MKVLGLNAFHGDASACLFDNGNLIVAAEEERFTRIKHAAGFPKNAIEFCLKSNNLKISDIDFIAINRNPKTRILHKLIYASSNLFNIKNLFNRLENFKKINSLENEFAKHFDIESKSLKNKIFHIDHHLAHAASSVIPSGYENSNYITVDGFGDFLSTTIGNYNGNKYKNFYEVKFPHSLGLFYTAITQYLGFKNYGDEYKVMGLASYGEPIYFNKMKNILITKKNKLFKLNLKFFVHHNQGLEMSWLDGEPTISNVYSNELINLLGPEQKKGDITNFHKDVAASAQKIYEITLFDMLNKLYELSPNDNLCMAGGCAMNSVANGKILKNTKFKNVYINHSPGDSGGAIGAAIIVQQKYAKINKKSVHNPYLGCQFTNNEIYESITKKKDIFKDKNVFFEKISSEKELISIVANELSKNKIVGWFQGRMEFGSRALGNRSIIADPREEKIRDILNSKIKRRESFRPFAPSVLKEYVSEWFDTTDDVPFMSKVCNVKKNKMKLVPAIVHTDGTGRLQTVDQSYNPRYYNLINEFNKITGVPLILNTSFNENEPIVCTPENAIDCFLRTEMDYLILEDYILTRT